MLLLRFAAAAFAAYCCRCCSILLLLLLLMQSTPLRARRWVSAAKANANGKGKQPKTNRYAKGKSATYTRATNLHPVARRTERAPSGANKL